MAACHRPGSISPTKQLGLKHLVVSQPFGAMLLMEEMIELVEMEIRELLEEMGSVRTTLLSKGLPPCALRTPSQLGLEAIITS